MNDFSTRHQDRIIGVLEGWDRIVFRGSLRQLSYVEGLGSYLRYRKVLLKDFGSFCQRVTAQVERRAKRIAQAAGRPYKYIPSAKLRKEDLVTRMIDQDGLTEGLVCVLACVEPCQSFEIYRNADTQHLELVGRQRKCRFFYFYYLHRELGLLHVRVQSWLPLDVQVCLNGRGYLQRRLDQAGIGYEKVDNTFVHIADVTRAQVMLNDLTRRHWARTLTALVRPLVGALLQDGGLLAGTAGYYWTVRQSEYATDVMFRDAAALKEVYPALCRHAMERFKAPDVLRFLAQKSCGRREVTSDYQRRIEGVRVKHRVGANSLKMYDKAGTVLRIETTVNDAGMFQVFRRAQGQPDSALTWRKMRKAVADLSRRQEVSRQANHRYLDALAVVGVPAPVQAVLDPISRAKTCQGQRVRALRPVSPEDAAFFAAVLRGEHLLAGFTNRQLQAILFPRPARAVADQRHRSAQVSHRLRLLRRHGLIEKIPKRRRYRVTAAGQRTMTLALAVRQSDSILLLAA
jgi:hypothetical protein